MKLKEFTIFLLFTSGLLPAFVCAGQHICDGDEFSITVDATSFVTDSDYQILVKRDGLPLARLNAPIVGSLMESHVGDLSGDGFCEVVVISRENASALPVIDIYRWKNFRLDPLRIESPSQILASSKNESVMGTVLKERLTILAEASNSVVGDSGRIEKRYVYSFPDARWFED
jgi:hypothetical protein